MEKRCRLAFQKSPEANESFFPEIAKFLAKVGQEHESGSVLPGCARLFVLPVPFLSNYYFFYLLILCPKCLPTSEVCACVFGLLCVAQQHRLCEHMRSNAAVIVDDVSEAWGSCADASGPGANPSKGFGEASTVLGGFLAECFPGHFVAHHFGV